jgi:hypothetical protein
MAIIAKDNKSDFTPAPEGLWQAVCVDVVDLGMQTSQWGESHRVQIRWQLEGDDPKTGKPYMAVRSFRLSLHEKSSLRPMLEAWRGRKFTPEELKGFDLEKLVGVACQVQIVHGITGQGGTFAQIQAVVPPARGVAKLTPRGDYVRVKDREHQAANGHDSPPDDDETLTPF